MNDPRPLDVWVDYFTPKRSFLFAINADNPALHWRLKHHSIGGYLAIWLWVFRIFITWSNRDG